ncbi:MAG: O-antigen ligase family protein [bacterium]
MRDVLARYWVVAHIAGLTVFFSWVYAGMSPDFLLAVPWLSLAVLEMALLLPPARKDENLELARRRVWRSVVRDPLLYIGCVLCLYLLFQCLNGGTKLEFNPASDTWAFGSSPLGWGPFCVEQAAARQLLYWFPPALAVLLGVRHGTNRFGKLMLLRILVANGALLGLFGLVQTGLGASHLFGMTPLPEPFFATFSDTNQAGAFFILLSAMALGLFLQALLTEKERPHAIWLGAALALNLTGAFCSLSRAAILVALLLIVAGGVYALRHAWRLVDMGVRVKALAIFVLLLIFGAAFLLYGPMDNPVLRELRAVPWSRFGEETFGARWQQLSSAWNIWLTHPWFGVGGYGYRHFVCLELDEGARVLLHRGGVNVHNDAMQFLVEHGLVGFGLMLGSVAVLLAPVVRRLRVAHTTNQDGWTVEPWLVLRVSPVTMLLLTGTTLVVLMSLIDLPFRSPAILVTWCIALACAPVFLPAAKRGVAAVTTGATVKEHEPDPVVREPEA